LGELWNTRDVYMQNSFTGFSSELNNDNGDGGGLAILRSTHADYRKVGASQSWLPLLWPSPGLSDWAINVTGSLQLV
jgi:hypothetical protein